MKVGIPDSFFPFFSFLPMKYNDMRKLIKVKTDLADQVNSQMKKMYKKILYVLCFLKIKTFVCDFVRKFGCRNTKFFHFNSLDVNEEPLGSSIFIAFMKYHFLDLFVLVQPTNSVYTKIYMFVKRLKRNLTWIPFWSCKMKLVKFEIQSIRFRNCSVTSITVYPTNAIILYQLLDPA